MPEVEMEVIFKSMSKKYRGEISDEDDYLEI
jgi:hypothetical protein